jgi:hypothetical protein
LVASSEALLNFGGTVYPELDSGHSCTLFFMAACLTGILTDKFQKMSITVYYTSVYLYQQLISLLFVKKCQLYTGR